MILSALYLMIGAVAYAPPSNEDAREAIAARLAEERYKGDTYKSYGEYPDYVNLLRCKAQNQHEVFYQNGFSRTLEGHDCLITISLPSRGAYQVDGFFHYDGVSWNYYGQIYPYRSVGLNTYEVPDERSAQTPKAGSILYDGQPGGGDITKPYESLFTPSDEWVRKPARQPLYYDPQTGELVRR